RLQDAVELAQTNYPSIRTAEAQVKVASAGIDLARDAYLPRLDLIWQENRASVNNVFGTLLCRRQSFRQSRDPCWGQNLSTAPLAAWEPFDFGYRKANVGVARDL